MQAASRSALSSKGVPLQNYSSRFWGCLECHWSCLVCISSWITTVHNRAQPFANLGCRRCLDTRSIGSRGNSRVEFNSVEISSGAQSNEIQPGNREGRHQYQHNCWHFMCNIGFAVLDPAVGDDQDRQRLCSGGHYVADFHYLVRHLCLSP